ncbi:MAG: hypothetical protein JXR19_08185 [Bacteroidia bacterium]
MKTELLTILLFLAVGAAAQPGQKHSVRSNDLLLQKISNLEDMIYDLHRQLNSTNTHASFTSWRSPVKNLDIGIGIGMQTFNSRPYTYYANESGRLQKFQGPTGFSPVLSAVLAHPLTKESGIVINVPLLELSRDVASSMSLLSKRYVLGLGYEYRFPAAAVFVAVNVASFPVVIEEVVQYKFFDQEPYTTIDIADLPKQTNYTYGFGFGVSIPIWSSRAKPLITSKI